MKLLIYWSAKQTKKFLKNPHLMICLLIPERGRRGAEVGRWRQGERGREREKHQCVREMLINCLLHCPDWGLNLQPFGVWDDILQPPKPPDEGQTFKIIVFFLSEKSTLTKKCFAQAISTFFCVNKEFKFI